MATLIAASTLVTAQPAWSAPEAFNATQQERFAAAFGLERPEKRDICDPWLRLPASLFDAGVESPASLASAEPGTDRAHGDAAQPAPDTLVQAPTASPRFLRSDGVPVLRTQYDERWREVREAGLSAACAQQVMGRSGPPDSPKALLAFNRMVNHRVRYVDDRAAGRNDQWAIASNTLTTRAGDCEDVAILKLQLLVALGVPEGDVYFALVRDRVRNRDHALVVVRSAGGPVLLDSLSDLPIDANVDDVYQPVLAFSGEQKWLLGVKRQAANAPIVSAR